MKHCLVEQEENRLKYILQFIIHSIDYIYYVDYTLSFFLSLCKKRIREELKNGEGREMDDGKEGLYSNTHTHKMCVV